MTENEAYLAARDAFWAEQAVKDARWAKVRKLRKPAWMLLAIVMLALLAFAGGAQILVVIALAFLLAATWKIWVWLGLMGIVVLHHPPKESL